MAAVSRWVGLLLVPRTAKLIIVSSSPTSDSAAASRTVYSNALMSAKPSVVDKSLPCVDDAR
jgi:hypothetical protein